MSRWPALVVLLGVPTAAAAAPAGCTQPNTDLAVIMDSSHSISEEDFTLEKEGFARALEDASKTPQDGSVCVTVIEFNRRATVRVPFRCIASPTDAAAVAADVRAIALPGGDNQTGVDLALARATDELTANARANARQVISLATDGLPNVTEESCNVRPVPSCPVCASLDAIVAAAKAAGIDELGVVTVEDRENLRGPLAADDFVRFYGCRVFGEDDSAAGVVTVRDFTEFARVVTNTVATVGCGTRVDLADVTALPSGAAEVTASLVSGVGTAVRTAGADIAANRDLATVSCADCVVASTVQDELTCSPSPDGLHATVDARGGAPLPDGPLFTCRFGIPPTVALGTVIALENRPHAVAGDGTALAAVGRNGSIEVTSCPQDPGECADGGRTTLRLARARFAAASKSTTAMRLRAGFVNADLGGFDPARAVAFLQVGADGTGAGVCAEVPFAAFRRRGRAFVFRSRRQSIASAKGLDRVVVRLGPGGSVRLRARGHALELSPPGPGVLQVRLGIREPDGEPDLCPVAEQSFRSARKKAVVFP